MNTKLTAVLINLAILTGCGASNGPKLDLNDANSLRPNMTQEQVLSIMKVQPNVVNFSNAVTEWHYCSQTPYDNWPVMEFRALFFLNDRLRTVKPYTVNSEKSYIPNAKCRAFVRQGTYSEPDVIKEYRVKGL